MGKETSSEGNSPPQQSQEQLYAAAAKGDAKGVIQALRQGADIDAPNAEKRTALHLAAEGGHSNVTRELIRRGADVMANAAGNTPLDLAVENGKADTARVLINGGGEPAIAKPENLSKMLNESIARKDEGTAMALVVHCGANVNTRDGQGTPLLHHAVAQGMNDLAKTMLEAGADVKSRDAEGKTALHVAAATGNDKAAKDLIYHRADIIATSKFQDTPAHDAAANGHQNVLETLTKEMVRPGKKAEAPALDAASQFRVGKMVDAVFSPSNTDEQNQAACKAINTVLKPSPEISVQDLGNKEKLKETLSEGIQKSFPDAKGKVGAFVKAVQDPAAGLPADNPLKTYQVEGLSQAEQQAVKRQELMQSEKPVGFDAVNRVNAFGDTPYDMAKQKGQEAAATFLERKGGHSNMPQDGLENLAKAREGIDNPSKPAAIPKPNLSETMEMEFAKSGLVNPIRGEMRSASKEDKQEVQAFKADLNKALFSGLMNMDMPEPQKATPSPKPQQAAAEPVPEPQQAASSPAPKAEAKEGLVANRIKHFTEQEAESKKDHPSKPNQEPGGTVRETRKEFEKQDKPLEKKEPEHGIKENTVSNRRAQFEEILKSSQGESAKAGLKNANARQADQSSPAKPAAAINQQGNSQGISR